MSRNWTKRRFSEEFKAETVKRVKQNNRSMADVATELGINASSDSSDSLVIGFRAVSSRAGAGC